MAVKVAPCELEEWFSMSTLKEVHYMRALGGRRELTHSVVWKQRIESSFLRI